jgi:hypothetical protein
MRIYVDCREAHILNLALTSFKQHYPITYGAEAQALQNKLHACIQLQKSGKELRKNEAVKRD